MQQLTSLVLDHEAALLVHAVPPRRPVHMIESNVEVLCLKVAFGEHGVVLCHVLVLALAGHDGDLVLLPLLVAQVERLLEASLEVGKVLILKKVLSRK